MLSLVEAFLIPHMSLALLTDLYQLTMAYSYWKADMHEQASVFHLFFRKNPFKGNYAIAAGLQPVMDFLENFRFEADDIEYLASLKGNDGKALFEMGFLVYLGEMRFSCTVHAIPEGTPVFPHEPLLRIQGNIIQCQLLETPLLNLLNFQTLIATKAARVCHAAKGESVLEFGLRRAQGQDGALGASRAAFIGGCDATSNVLAGKLFGIPVRGTHAHSWVMSFAEEITAFETYSEAMPNNCVFLVDTYNTIEGVKKAIIVGRKLREKGYKLAGIRLDSGDLADLSQKARILLDDAGFESANIVASNDLDEYSITELKRQGAKINVWGVGTKLVTGYDQPALGGVYKLSAIRKAGEDWQYRIKLSEQIIKVSNPGILQVRRFYNKENGQALGDMIYSESIDSERNTLVSFNQSEKEWFLDADYEDILVPIFENGEKIYNSPSLSVIRQHCLAQISRFPAALWEFSHYNYMCGLEENLQNLKEALLRQRR